MLAFGAAIQIRTGDLILTKDALYQLSYRAMIAQVRAASYRGNVLYYIGKSACCQAQICEKSNFLQKGAQTRCLGEAEQF